MSENIECPNCNKSLKNGILNSNKLLPQNKIDIINLYIENKSEGYCDKCGPLLYKEYETMYYKETNSLFIKIESHINNIPVISTHSPLNWDYEILEMVTGQSTTGTGVLTELTSTFTDLFGAQSEKHNKKLKDGENMCFKQIRKTTLDLGGNAVIAVDIDYSELGAAKGMIMVCMSGTAVKLKNQDLLGEKKSKIIDSIKVFNERLNFLKTFVPEIRD